MAIRSGNVALAGGAGLTSIGMGLIAPGLPAYAQSLGAGATLVGLLLAGFGVTRLLVSLSTAWLATRVGHRRLLVAAPAITAPAAALCAVSGSFLALALFCLLEGALAAVYATVGLAAIMGRSKPDGRSGALSMYQTAGLLGAAVGPAFGGWVAQRFGPGAPFLLYAALSTLAALWIASRIDPETLSSVGEPAQTPTMERRRFGHTLLAPGLLGLWLVIFAIAFTRVGTQLAALPLIGAWQLGLDPQQIGLALSLSGLTSVFIFYPGGWLADRYGRGPMIVLGALFMIGSQLLLALSGGYTSFLLSALSLGAGGGLAGPAMTAYLADSTAAGDRVTGVGVYRALGDAGAALAPPTVGWLADRDGYEAALTVPSVLVLAAIGTFVRLAGGGHRIRTILVKCLPSTPGTRVLAVVGLTVIYASCFIAIKAGLPFAPPLRFGGLRALVGGVALLGLVLALRQPVLPRRQSWGWIAALALVSTTLAFGAMFLAPGRTGVGLASVLGNTQPLITIGLASMFLGERMTGWKWAALLLGAMGVALISYRSLTGPEAYGVPGALLAISASASAAFGSVIVKRMGTQHGLLVVAAWQLLLGSLPLLLVSAGIEDAADVVWNAEFVGLLLFLALVGTAFATAAWYWLIERDEVGRLTMFLYLIPVVGLGLASLVYGEEIDLVEGIGILLTLAGIGSAAWESWRGSRPSHPTLDR